MNDSTDYRRAIVHPGGRTDHGGSLRALTSAEARTLQTLLASPDASDLERIRISGLPSSTYNVVRRRLEESGAVREVLVPNPGPMGMDGIEVRWARPSADRRAELRTEWTGDPRCGLGWLGLHHALGVFLGPGSPRGPDGPGSFSVRAAREEGSVPVYFDFSGLWARYSSEGSPPEYPRGLDLRGPPADRHRVLQALSTLGGATGVPTSEEAGSAGRRSRPPPELLEERVLLRRFVLDPARIPPYDGRRLGEWIVVAGTRRSSVAVPTLLNRLIREAGIAPFLLAEGEGKLLLAGLGVLGAEGPGRRPIAPRGGRITPVFESLLERYDIAIEPVESLDAFVPHRYGPAAGWRSRAGRTGSGGT